MERIDANLYLNLVRGGAARLGLHRQAVNDLNVFPIPDGDTGDNMYMTVKAGCDAAGATLPEMAKAVHFIPVTGMPMNFALTSFSPIALQ